MVDRYKKDKELKALYPLCPMSIAEARELSWRLFYHLAGGPERVVKIDGTQELKICLNKSEACFSAILINKIKKDNLEKLIGYSSTDIWKKEYKDKEIKIPTMSK